MQDDSKKIPLVLPAAAIAMAAVLLLAGCDVGVGQRTQVQTAQAGTEGSAKVADSESARYVVTDIGTVGGPEAYPYDVDDTGWIAGFSWTLEGRLRAYRWGAGSMIDLGSLDNTDSVGYGVNARGQVAGVTNAAQGMVGFLWKAGTMTALLPLPTGEVQGIESLNDRGDVVGYSTVWNPVSANFQAHATLWRNGAPIDLGTINGGAYSQAVRVTNDGQVVAFGDSAANQGVYQAFTWRNGVTTVLGTLGGVYSFPNAVNKAGHVVGQAETASGDLHAFLWTERGMIDLGTLGGTTSEALALNDQGAVVGTSTTADGATHAFVWSEGSMIDLGTLGGDYTESKAVAINNRGQIVGSSSNPQTGSIRPLLWNKGKRIELPHIQAPPYVDFTVARFITDRGLIVGDTGILLDPVAFVLASRTLIWQSNDDARVVGQ